MLTCRPISRHLILAVHSFYLEVAQDEFIVYTVSFKKTGRQTHGCNLVKHWPIFKISSQLKRGLDLQQNSYFSPYILTMLPHNLEKVKGFILSIYKDNKQNSLRFGEKTFIPLNLWPLHIIYTVIHKIGNLLLIITTQPNVHQFAWNLSNSNIP